ncbi:unnamed protein product [Cochlearia groenlandica]
MDFGTCRVFAGDQPNQSSEKEGSDRGENFERDKQKILQEDSVEEIDAYYNAHFREVADVAGPSKPTANEDHVSDGIDKKGSVGGSVNLVNFGFDVHV